MKIVGAETEQKIKDYVFARDAETKWKKIKEGLHDELLESMPDAQDGDLVVDAMEENVLLTVKVITSYRLNQKRVRAEHPEVYAKCQDTSTQVRLETPK